jgi:hypothetical protein
MHLLCVSWTSFGLVHRHVMHTSTHAANASFLFTFSTLRCFCTQQTALQHIRYPYTALYAFGVTADYEHAVPGHTPKNVTGPIHWSGYSVAT